MLSDGPVSSSGQPSWRPAQITSLFSHTLELDGRQRVTRTFAVVRPFQELSHDEELYDPYSQYGFSGGRLVYEDWDESVLASMPEILGHCSVNSVQITGIGAKTPVTRSDANGIDRLGTIRDFEQIPQGAGDGEDEAKSHNYARNSAEEWWDWKCRMPGDARGTDCP
ncbi:hypothetical protein K523DRAFT_381516 [Schizophyllum commune Tattone D]|nr:hypothetical protein K523DRAFT_381516 [Schizophyllum commune Tattone D]